MQIHNDQKIAVVGLGALFPDAKNINQFWQNIISKKVSIKALPDDFLESDIYYRPELFTALNKQDKTITKVAARIEDLSFDTVRRYKIPPSVAEHMDENQHAALESASQALEMNTLETISKDRVGVIFGNGMVGTQYGDALVRVQFQLIEHYLRTHKEFSKLGENIQTDIIEYVRDHALEGSLPISEDSAPGILPNIIAARIANVYDFNGPSFTVDAACASVLAAIIKGIQALYLNDLDAVVCGGSDMPLKQLGFIFFSAINALSPDGSFPFDKRANGFVMGQGAGAVILKRLEDAIRDKDQIYAVITGYGEASDGKGKYIAAPNADWQAKTIEKACQMAGYSVDTIELVEAHGTATVVGDVVEVEGLKKAFAALNSTRKNYCGLSSVKSNIGHLKSAAGVAGFIKAALALHHKKLPPTASFQEINPKLQLEDSPFYILDETRDWKEPNGHPRRANVSSFGFGGADYHIAMEEFNEAYHTKTLVTGFTSAGKNIGTVEPSAAPAQEPAFNIITFSAPDRNQLDAKITKFIKNYNLSPQTTFTRKVRLHNYLQDARHRHRLAILAASMEELQNKIELFNHELEKGVDLLKLKGIYYSESTPVRKDQVAVMFPGQASQYPGMFRQLFEQYDLMRNFYEEADAYWEYNHGHTVTSLMFPADETDSEALEQLRQTQHAHPAIFLSSYSVFQLFKQLGLDAKYMTGHSLGEITALAAAEKLTFSEALHLVDKRGYAFHNAKLKDPGKMISIMGDEKMALEHVEKSGLPVKLANINSPRQSIVAGSSDDIDAFKSYLDKNRVSSKILFVSHAFHSDVVKPVAEMFFKEIKDIEFRKSNTQVIMNHLGKYYPNTVKELPRIPKLLKDQILESVNFVQSLQKLYKDGARVFIEMGPGSILSSLCKDILKNKDISILTTNYKNKDDLENLQKFHAELFTNGIKVKPLPEKPVIQKSNTPVIPSSDTPVLHQSKTQTSNMETIVYSGVSIGLPGSYKESFRDDNFEQIFQGHNFIERLTDAEKQKMVDLQITKLIKDERGPSFKLLESLDDVIQLAGKVGRLDMLEQYRIDEKDLDNMSSSISLGVAAGYEALRDAQIPLVREYIKTSTGKLLPHKLSLPNDMQEDTGVIFANGFPLIDPVIEEVSRYISFKYGSKTRKDLMEFYEKLLERVKDHDTRKILTDWYTLNYSRFNDNPGVEDVYQFNYNFMMQISAQANNRLASLINAKGPNFQMNAACSSTSNAVTIAEDFIRTGRVKRMIVVGADDPTSETNFAWLGAGFLCTGAATNEHDLYKAAVPFDLRRNGMIISAGAVGLVLESKSEVEKRGVREVCELVGTHSFNTAKHPSQIDSDQFGKELDKFINKIEQNYNIDRKELASQLLYLSHETYTPARGGCSQTEAEALKTAFGQQYENIIISNTKGMTGHAMGAALEDAVAAKALQLGKMPPVVNYHTPDPMLNGLNLSKGGSHERTYALKMSAGFGSQGNFMLLKKTTSGESRISDKALFESWLDSISNGSGPETGYLGRLYVIKDQIMKGDNVKAVDSVAVSEAVVHNTETMKTATAEKSVQTEKPKDKSEFFQELIELIAAESSYPVEMLEPDMEVGADLGLTEEIRKSIQKGLIEKFGEKSSKVEWTEELTLGELADQVYNVFSAEQSPAEEQHSVLPATVPSGDKPSKESISSETLKVFSEVTKYPEDMLEMDMEMEADLGIDTVKQATILSILGEKYMMERDDSIQLSNYPTIGHIVDLVHEKAGAGIAEEAAKIVAEEEPPKPVTEEKTAPQTVQQDGEDKETIRQETVKVFSEVTKYPEDMLEMDMEMEADLGIDTVKQATILSILGEKYMMERDDSIQLSNYPTIGHIVDLVYEKSNTVSLDNIPQADFSEIPDKEPEISPEEIRIPEKSDLTRQVVVLEEAKRDRKRSPVRNRNVWILSDHGIKIPALEKVLKEKQAKVSKFVFPGSLEEKGLEKQLDAFFNGNSPDIIIDLTHIGKSFKFDHKNTELTHKSLDESVVSRFLFYKILDKKIEEPSRILCLTSIDGYLGYDVSKSRVSDPIFGSVAGFYKALRKEWMKSRISILDLPPEDIKNKADAVSKTILSEIEYSGPGFEVAFAGGKRRIAKIDEKENRSDQKVKLDQNDVILITGGGTGVGGQVLKAMAKRYESKYIVIDIVDLPDDIETYASLDEAGLEKLRADLREELKKTRQKVTPVMVNREFEAITKAVEVHNTLKDLRQKGREVVYISCDVRDYDKLNERITKARGELGDITAIVHAAGVEKSHLMDQKTLDEFRLVYSVKTRGAMNLSLICRDDPLKLVVTFSSISGRFGNAAQLDYSAANSFLNYWIKMLQDNRPGLNALSLSWSGWKDVGMAWRNEFVRQTAEEMGLNYIEVPQGLAAFFTEIENISGDREVLLHKGLNGFLEPDIVVTPVHNFPLIDRVNKNKGSIARAYRMFSTRRDSMLDQHRLGKVPIMPAVGYSELAAEFYALHEGEKDCYVIRNLTFSNAFKLFHEQPRELYIEGTPAEQGVWNIEIKSLFQLPKTGVTQTVLHSKSSVSSDIIDYTDMDPETWHIDQSNPVELSAEESLLLIQDSEVEQRIILGPLFNDVLRDSESKEPVLIYPKSTIYPTYFPKEQLTNDKYPLQKMLVNPCFLDSIYQACAAHLLVNKKRVYLPWEVGELGIVDVPKEDGLYRSYTNVVEDNDEIVAFNVVMVDADGKIRYYGRNVQFRRINL